MTNFEKYKDEILLLAINNRGFAFHMNKITDCKLSGCKNCIFTGACIANRIKWLYEEYQEPAPKLTKTEKGFCEIIKDGYIARDKNGDLYLYNNPPHVTETDWRADYGHCTRLCTKFFPFITWESNRNWSIEDLLKLEVCDD